MDNNKLVKPLKSERGAALMIALFAMTFLLVLATNISYETQVNYVSSAQGLNKLKAFYAAKAGADISLFRIALYQKVREALDSQIKSNPQALAMVDQIWKFPFSWPPVLPDDASSFTKDDIDETVEESFMDAQYVVTIRAEGGRIDLNDIGSPVEAISNAAKDSLLRIFQSEVENNEDFEEEYQNYDFNVLVNNIADWVDEDTEGRNSSAESQNYPRPDDADIQLPPNRGFRTLDELRMVDGMNDTFYDLLKDKVTVFGTKGINPNEASREVIMSLDPNMTEEIVTEVLNRRADLDKGGPFRDDDDFFGFLQSEGLNIEDLRNKDLPLYYNAAYNFRIISTGKSANTRREITAITFDFENLAKRYKTQLDEQCIKEGRCPDPNAGGGGNGGSQPGNTNQQPNQNEQYKAPKERPTVVYWEES